MNRENREGNTYTNLLFSLFFSFHVYFTVWFNKITKKYSFTSTQFDLDSDDLFFEILLRRFLLTLSANHWLEQKRKNRCTLLGFDSLSNPKINRKERYKTKSREWRKTKSFGVSEWEMKFLWIFCLWRFYLQYNHLLLLVLNKVICISWFETLIFVFCVPSPHLFSSLFKWHNLN